MNAEIIARLERSTAQGDNWEVTAVVRRLLLALQNGDPERRKAAEFEALTFLADFPLEAKKLMLAWESLRPAGPARGRITPAQLADIEAMLDRMVEPELEEVVEFLRRSGWTVLAPSNDVNVEDVEKQIMDLTGRSRLLKQETSNLDPGSDNWVHVVRAGLKDIQKRIDNLALATVDNWHQVTTREPIEHDKAERE